MLTVTGAGGLDISSQFVYDPMGPCNAGCTSCDGLINCQACASGKAPVGGVCPSTYQASLCDRISWLAAGVPRILVKDRACAAAYLCAGGIHGLVLDLLLKNLTPVRAFRAMPCTPT